MNIHLLLELPINVITNILDFLPTTQLWELQYLHIGLKQIMQEIQWERIFHFRKDISDEELLNVYNAWNITKIDLSYCDNITDNSVKYLGECYMLILDHCHQITDDSVQYLGNCHILDLSVCQKLTVESIKHLQNCWCIIFWGQCHVDDTCAQYLTNCRILDLVGSPISDKGMELLVNCQEIVIDNYKNVTGECIQKMIKKGVNVHNDSFKCCESVGIKCVDDPNAIPEVWD